MAYRPLATFGAPRPIRDFVADRIDMQFEDVHAMMRLPLTGDDGLRAGCNFACLTTLCVLIAGTSTIFYSRIGNDGERFCRLLVRYDPWRLQPKGGLPRTPAADVLWREYRSPLSHSLGVFTKQLHPKKNKRKRKRVVLSTELTITKAGLSEAMLAALENPAGPPPSWLRPLVLQYRPGSRDVSPATLYWGTLRLFEKLLADPVRMSSAARFLRL